MQSNNLKAIRNQHSDIFNTKDAHFAVIANKEVPADVVNVFHQKSQQAYKKYQQSIKRPSSSYKKCQIKEDKYTFDSQWSNPRFECQKTHVNEKVTFDQDYHHQRRHEQLKSSIFVNEDQKELLRNQYKKQIQAEPQTTRNPNKSATYGRKSTITREYDDDNICQRKGIPNYSNLFGITQRNTQSKDMIKSVVQPLIPNKMTWEQFDSVLQRGSKDEAIKADYHIRKYYENMKSSLDTHKNYTDYMPKNAQDEKQNKPQNIVVKATQKVAEIPQPKIQTDAPRIIASKLQTRTQSAVKQKKTNQILILKGLNNKFNLAVLGQQCKLNSIILSQFNNETNDSSLNGRGSILVIPQKKYGIENLCSWLKSQGLTIKLKN